MTLAKIELKRDPQNHTAAQSKSGKWHHPDCGYLKSVVAVRRLDTAKEADALVESCCDSKFRSTMRAEERDASRAAFLDEAVGVRPIPAIAIECSEHGPQKIVEIDHSFSGASVRLACGDEFYMDNGALVWEPRPRHPHHPSYFQIHGVEPTEDWHTADRS